MGLNPKQKEAVEYLDGPLLVLAGPGTGKTQLLSEKVAYILKNTDTAPENILCITFTENGAKNMHERLKRIVGPDGLKVNVSTYHAFGSEILALYKNYSEEYDRPIDSPIDEVTQFKMIKKIRDCLPGKDILRADQVKDILGVISSAKSNNLTANDLETIANVNIEDSEVLSAAISPILHNVVPNDFQRSYDEAYTPIYESLKPYMDNTQTVPGVSSPIERSICIMARDMKEAYNESGSSGRITVLTQWRDTYFEKTGSGAYRLKDRVANKKLISIAKVMRAYEAELKENGLYDFNDMIQEAIRILKKDKGFRLTLEERYQYIMLDEFQDTNPSQLAIIKLITDYEKPVIMAVGDDDQAIFEFQGALASNFQDFQGYYNAHVIALTENYRSTQEILDFSHTIIMEAPDRFADKELIAHRESLPETGILRAEFLTSDMEYDFVASKIAELVRAGVSQNEIAIISQKRKYFEPLLPFLKGHKEISIAYDKQNDLLQDEKMHQIFTIARYVYECANEKRPTVSVLEILSYPFFGLPIMEVLKLMAKAKNEKRATLEVLLETENPDIKAVVEFLTNLMAKSFTEPLELMLDYIVGSLELNGFSSKFLEYYVKNNDYSAFSLYSNLASLRGKLHKHFGDKNLKLADLINMIDDYADAEMALSVVSPYRDADEAVSVLTAHGAKGLEFEHVFVVTADHTAWGKGKGNNSFLTLPKNLTHIRHTMTTDSERLRVLYVALTRAKEHLYITNALKDFNEKSPARLEYFEEFEDDDRVVSPLIPSGEVKTYYDVSAFSSAEKNIRTWMSPYLSLSPDLLSLYKERVSNYRMSASSLTSFVDIVYAGPQEFFKSRILMAPSEPETEALAFGNIVHAVYEKITNSHISDEEAVQMFLSELEKKDLPSEVIQKLRDKGPADLAVSINKFSDILRDGKAEVNFAPDKIIVDGVPITGKIDHIKINEEDKTIEIYDFKTSGYHKEGWSSHTTLYKYMMQLGFYKLLLNNSRDYSKYKVTKAHILFVVPDNDGEVYDKVYEFNNKDEMALRELMQAVYYQISSLSFLDDEQLMIAPDHTKGIKKIKEFIKLLLDKNGKK